MMAPGCVAKQTRNHYRRETFQERTDSSDLKVGQSGLRPLVFWNWNRRARRSFAVHHGWYYAVRQSLLPVKAAGVHVALLRRHIGQNCLV